MEILDSLLLSPSILISSLMVVHADAAARQGLGVANSAEVEELKRRNAELEREVAELREREEAMRTDLERTRARLRVAEEAEERLRAQLGELEAEALAHARACHLRITELSNQLELARRAILNHSSSSLSSFSD